MIIDENEAEIVRTLFDLFLIHGTRAKTILTLHEKLIYPKKNLKTNDSGDPVKWTTQTLGNVINEAAYSGYKEVNKLYKTDNPDVLKPWQKYQMVKASWTPIIEESKFWEAQRLVEEASVGTLALKFVRFCIGMESQPVLH